MVCGDEVRGQAGPEGGRGSRTPEVGGAPGPPEEGGGPGPPEEGGAPGPPEEEGLPDLLAVWLFGPCCMPPACLPGQMSRLSRECVWHVTTTVDIIIQCITGIGLSAVLVYKCIYILHDTCRCIKILP